MSQSDRELLIGAARATGRRVPQDSPYTGIEVDRPGWPGRGFWRDISGDGRRFETWNPLNNNADAFMLATDLRMTIQPIAVGDGTRGWRAECGGVFYIALLTAERNSYVAMRLAITACAAEVARGTEDTVP